MSLTPEQIEERRNYVTGTDSSVILGVNPYDSLFDIWQFKLGLSDGKDLSNNPRVSAGNYLEDGVSRMFADKLGKRIELPGGLVKHPEHSWMAGNIDRWLPDENVGLEIKTTSSAEGWGDQGINVIPKHYLCQVAHYMCAARAAYWYVAVLIGGWDFRWYRIERSILLEQKLIEKEYEFWTKNVQAKVPPEPRNCSDVVSLYRNRTIDTPIIADPRIENVVNKLKDVKMRSKVIDAEEQKIKDEIALFMRANEFLMSGHGEVLATWRQAKDYEKFDTKTFEKEHPELYKKYLTMSPGSRRFLLKGE